MVRLEFSDPHSGCSMEDKLEDFKLGVEETSSMIQLRDDGGLT